MEEKEKLVSNEQKFARTRCWLHCSNSSVLRYFSCASYLKKKSFHLIMRKKINFYKSETGNDVKNTLHLAHVQKSISRLLLKTLV